MGTYEVLCILPVNMAEGERTSRIDDFRGMAEQAGATTVKEDTWGRRRLAYPINKQPEGFYHLYVFETEPGSLDDLDRRMRNSDDIMRHMIVRTDLETRRARKKGVLDKPDAEAAGESDSEQPETKSPQQKTELSESEAVEAKKKADSDAPIKKEAGPVEPESTESSDDDKDAAESDDSGEEE